MNVDEYDSLVAAAIVRDAERWVRFQKKEG